jgi:hypothetical protein
MAQTPKALSIASLGSIHQQDAEVGKAIQQIVDFINNLQYQVTIGATTYIVVLKPGNKV